MTNESRGWALVDSCRHEGVDSGEYYVCCKCGLVLDNLYGLNRTENCIAPSQYNDRKRLKAVDHHLIAFLEKVGLQTSIYPLQESLRILKTQGHYKTINYAIALSCIMQDNVEAREKLSPWLPKYDQAWVRCVAIWRPVPQNFMWLWMIHLMRNAQELSPMQEKRFLLNVSQFDEHQDNLLHGLIACYGVDYHIPFDMELKWLLYKYSCAILKPSYPSN